VEASTVRFSSDPLRTLAWISPIAVFMLIYLPSAGLGFVSDDFGWIADSRIDSVRDAIALFGKNHGFYRPVVGLSFGLNFAAVGLEPLFFGLTNLALCALCAILIVALFRALGLGLGASGFGAAVWMLNVHGINMAVLWISGRSALLMIAAALGSAVAAVLRRPIVATALLTIALLSKEEAVVLPVLLVALTIATRSKYPRSKDVRCLVVLLVGSACALALYAFLRLESGAMTSSTAPSYYQLTFEPTLVARNLIEYFDRAATFAIAAALVAWLCVRPDFERVSLRAEPIIIGCLWYAGGFAITTFLPVRSSLYACLPSIGVALIVAEFCSACWQAAGERGRRRALIATVVIPMALLPVYVARNHRWTDLAVFSTRLMRDLAGHAPEAAGDTWIVLLDRNRDQRVNVQSVFGALVEDAVSLRVGHRVHVWVEPPMSPPLSDGLRPPCPSCRSITLAVDAGHLRAP
jgi:hypothetical protein